MRLACALPLLLLVSCIEYAETSPEDTGTLTAPIQGGSADSETRSVLAIQQQRGGLCSGTLIAPNLVLTARHCVSITSDGGVAVNCDETIFSAPFAPETITVSPDAAVTSVSPQLRVAEVMVPPDSRFLCGNDIALVRLAENIPPSVAPTLSPRLDGGQAEQGERYSAVGYGALDGDGDGEGMRRRRDGLTAVCSGEACSGATPFGAHVDEAEWVGDGGVCKGDSGGPALDERERVIGVTSRGAADCSLSIYTSLANHSDWLRAHARRAAKAGSYAPPHWAMGSDEDAAADVGDAAEPSCSAALPRRQGEFSCTILWLAMIAIARRRRISRDAHAAIHA